VETAVSETAVERVRLAHGQKPMLLLLWGFQYSAMEALLHIVNDTDILLKNLVRLKDDVEAVRRNIELALGSVVMVVRIVK